MYIFVVSIALADSLALLGAGTSAAAEMTNIRSCINTGPTLGFCSRWLFCVISYDQ